MEIDLGRQSLAITVREVHDVGDARRQAQNAARDMSFNDTAHGRVGIVATELAGNLVKHAGGGTLVLRRLTCDGQSGLEIMSLDDGPGMDVRRCLEDGYSTAGSPGTGLGAVQRMSQRLDIYSQPGKGSVLVTEIWPGSVPDCPYDIGAICLPVAGERLCGDGWAVRVHENDVDVIVSDGLGHGPMAALATDAALEAFHRRPEASPGTVLEMAHAALRSTRGAAVLTARFDFARRHVTCAGVGNISGSIVSPATSKGMVSSNGIVGHQVHKIKEFGYDCHGDDVLLFHSDGLTTHWRFDDFPGLALRSAGLIAGVIYKTFKRGRDDATIVVVRRR